MSHRNKIKRAEDIRRELAALDKRWIRAGRLEQRRVQTRIHSLRAELRQLGGSILPVLGLLGIARAW